jgi:CRISPR-associated protein Csd1
MIEDLIRLFDTLSENRKIPEYGWEYLQVPYGIDVNDDGQIINVIPLGNDADKKKALLKVPKHGVRASKVAANFLCDTLTYLVADDSKGSVKRARQCFDDCANLHCELMGNVDNPVANAIRNFFARGPQQAVVKKYIEEKDWKKAAQANFVLCYHDIPVTADSVVKSVWNEHFAQDSAEGEVYQSLIDGQSVIPANIHPKIKGVWGAQSSGGALISFNKAAFNSYGKEQNLNAPMSSVQAYKYTTALNYLLADERHVIHLGDTTIVFWAESSASQYQDLLLGVLGDGPKQSTENSLNTNVFSAIQSLSKGQLFHSNEFALSPDEHFYILGLSPNSARVSVRFYMKDTFGAVIQHVKRYYDDTAIQRPSYDKTSVIPIWRVLKQTVNQQIRADVPKVLVGGVLRAILFGVPYPASLLANVELRIRTERDINSDKAAIIKAYYTRHANTGCPKEVLQVNINEESEHVPYVLGRMFAIYEQIQRNANPRINTSIKDRYFASAASTPAMIFPILGNLSGKHLRKLNIGQSTYFSKQLQELSQRIGDRYPTRLSLPEQGSFQLGYYFQTEKNFEKHRTDQKDQMKNEGVTNE